MINKVVTSTLLQRLSFCVKDIYLQIREASQNTNHDKRKLLGLDKVLQIIRGEVANNTSKLTVIHKHTKKESKKLKEVEDDSTCS